MSDVRFDEVLARLDKVLGEVRELKGLVKKAELTQYTAEEALNKVIDDMLDVALPEWLEGPIPLEAFEKRFVRYLVYDEDIRRAIKHLVRKGLIRVYQEKWEDIRGKEHVIKTIYLSNDILPRKPKPGTVLSLVSDYYYFYWKLFGKHIARGTRVAPFESERIVEKIFQVKMRWLLEPYIKRRVLFREEDLREFIAERGNWALENILEEYGIVKTIVDEDDNVVALEFLMDETEAFKRISREVRA